MKNVWDLALAAICCVSFSCSAPDNSAPDNDETLMWYEAPASVWNEALPVGNSHLGAMVYGGVEKEELQLNEETFWAGGPHHNNSDKALEALPHIREMVFNDQPGEALKTINETFFTGQNGMGYMTMGSLILDFNLDTSAAISNYRRMLDLSRAVQNTTYEVNGSLVERTVLASLADDVIAVRISSDKPMDFTLSHVTPLKAQTTAENNALVIKCFGVSQEGVPAALDAYCRVEVSSDGATTPSEDKLKVTGAKETVIYLSAATNYVNYNDVSGNACKKAEAALSAARAYTWKELVNRHVTKYREQFDRVHLTLPLGTDATAPTARRVHDWRIAAVAFIHFVAWKRTD